MKNYTIIAIAMLFLGCQKENSVSPELTSSGLGSNQELVLSEAYDGSQLVQKNIFENKRLVSRTRTGTYQYDDANKLVIQTQSSQVNTYHYGDDGMLSYLIFSIKGKNYYRRDFFYEKDVLVKVSTYNIIPNSYYVYDLLYTYENPWKSTNSIVYKTEINGVPVPTDTVVENYLEWHSPFQLTEYNDQRQVSAVKIYSNTIKSPDYNLRNIPDLKPIPTRIPKADLMNSTDIWGAGSPKLLMLSEEYYNNGHLERRINVENIVLNKQGLPDQYDAVTFYAPTNTTTRVIKKFKYIAL